MHSLHTRADWLTVLFVRDPLERFLSGWLDKCDTQRTARVEQHCEPLALYLNGTKDNATKVLESVSSPAMQLGAYADTFPLSWNLHFFPQSLYCDDVGRSIEKYGFVGTMNDSFNEQVLSLGRRIDAHWAGATAATSDDLGSTAVAKTFSELRHAHDPHAKHATSKIEQLMTVRTARRLLEYFSIDYVELGLPLPEWLRHLPPPGRRGQLNANR